MVFNLKYYVQPFLNMKTKGRNVNKLICTFAHKAVEVLAVPKHNRKEKEGGKGGDKGAGKERKGKEEGKKLNDI